MLHLSHELVPESEERSAPENPHLPHIWCHIENEGKNLLQSIRTGRGYGTLRKRQKIEDNSLRIVKQSLTERAKRLAGEASKVDIEESTSTICIRRSRDIAMNATRAG